MRVMNDRGACLLKVLTVSFFCFTMNDAGGDFGGSEAAGPERDPLLADIDSKIQNLRIHNMQIKTLLNTSDALGGFRSGIVHFMHQRSIFLEKCATWDSISLRQLIYDS